MKNLNIAFMCLFVSFLWGCAELPSSKNVTKYEQYKNHIKARITYYHKNEDKYGNKIAIGGRAKEGTTIAVRRKLMALGRFCFIPQFVNILGTGSMRVEDRGRAVEHLKATHGKCEVADIYLDCKSQRIFKQRVAYYESKIGQFVDLFF